MNNTKAFTLIELLVVVLIIGILAAVALPQYQQAVEKSRAAEAFSNISSFHKAVEAWMLANPGKYKTFSGDGSGAGQLDIDVPADWIEGTSSMIAGDGDPNRKSCSKNFCYGVEVYKVTAYRANNSTYKYAISYFFNNNDPRYYCHAYTSADLKLCNSLSNMRRVDNSL